MRTARPETPAPGAVTRPGDPRADTTLEFPDPGAPAIASISARGVRQAAAALVVVAAVAGTHFFAQARQPEPDPHRQRAAASTGTGGVDDAHRVPARGLQARPDGPDRARALEARLSAPDAEQNETHAARAQPAHARSSAWTSPWRLVLAVLAGGLMAWLLVRASGQDR